MYPTLEDISHQRFYKNFTFHLPPAHMETGVTLVQVYSREIKAFSISSMGECRVKFVLF